MVTEFVENVQLQDSVIRRLLVLRPSFISLGDVREETE